MYLFFQQAMSKPKSTEDATSKFQTATSIGEAKNLEENQEITTLRGLSPFADDRRSRVDYAGQRSVAESTYIGTNCIHHFSFKISNIVNIPALGISVPAVPKQNLATKAIMLKDCVYYLKMSLFMFVKSRELSSKKNHRQCFSRRGKPKR